jgi:hypothetical protein
MRILIKLLLVLVLLQSCHSEPKALPVAEWQFIDADTLKPIEGGWVHAVWLDKPKSNGMTPCVRAVLGQTDANGWFRDTASKAHWQEKTVTTFFVPGYEAFRFQPGFPTEAEVTAYEPQYEMDVGKFPRFEAKLKSLGFKYQKGPFPFYGQQFAHLWTKVLSGKNYNDFIQNPGSPQRYFVKYRGFPIYVADSFGFLGRTCDKPGAENFGLAYGRVHYTDKLRTIRSTRFFCDPIWKGAQVSGYENEQWITRASWVFPNPEPVYKAAYEGYGEWNFNNLVALSKFDEQRKDKFCQWILPEVDKLERKIMAEGIPKPTLEVIPQKED